MKTVFITSTGTEVGKTYVAAALISALRTRGLAVNALKPVASGFPGDDVNDTDTAILLAALGRDVTDAAVEACSPWRFAEPLSPDMAARREGRAIDFDALVAFCRDAQGGGGDFLIIEGIGGALVPLDDTHTVTDWMTALEAPALVVAGSYLGTLSHTLATVAAMKARGAEIAGVAVDESEDSPVPVAETVETLERHLKGVPVAAVARNAPPDSVLAAVAGMIDA